MKQSTFAKALKFASHASAVKDIRYYLNGVLLEVVDAHNLVLVGTDGHRMAVVKLECVWDLLPPGQYIIPSADVSLLLKLLDPKATGELSVVQDGPALRFLLPSCQHIVIPMDARYPDWRRVSRQDEEPKGVGRYRVNADYLSAAAKACATLTGRFSGVDLVTYGHAYTSFRVAPSPVSLEGVTDAYVIVMPMRGDK